ncbi:MAG: site-specific integrase [Planctomycetota bacterium]
MPRQPKTPSYRLHKASKQAITTLTDVNTGRRRDVLLGPHGSPESRRLYDETIAAWLAAGRVLDAEPPETSPPSPGTHTLAAVLLSHWKARLQRYGLSEGDRLSSQLMSVRRALGVARSIAGRDPADNFGPLRLQEVRQAMIDRGWTRSYVNRSIREVVNAIRHGVAIERVRPETVTALECVKPLKRGELGVAEGKPVKPVPDAHIAAIEPYVSRQVWALVQLQLLTGARAGELVIMRAVDLDTAGKVWLYRPSQHKGTHRGQERTVYLGPRAQAVVAPFLVGRPVKSYLFSPAEAEAERRERQHAARKTPLSCGNKPGSNRAPAPQRKPREHFTTDTYGRAIRRGCERAGVDPWGVHRLRHNAATELRREFGIEAARLILGHRAPSVTETYAELSHDKAIDVIARVG